jgi:hypothetical protein
MVAVEEAGRLLVEVTDMNASAEEGERRVYCCPDVRFGEY